MTLQKIISGGQTGADRGALRAAKILKFPYGGFIPKGRKAEDGRVPDKFDKLVELDSSDYLVRTRKNVEAADATLVICKGGLTNGSDRTIQICKKLGKPFAHYDLWNWPSAYLLGMEIKKWIDTSGVIWTLNIAGTRESKAKGIELDVAMLTVNLISAQYEFPQVR